MVVHTNVFWSDDAHAGFSHCQRWQSVPSSRLLPYRSSYVMPSFCMPCRSLYPSEPGTGASNSGTACSTPVPGHTRGGLSVAGAGAGARVQPAPTER